MSIIAYLIIENFPQKFSPCVKNCLPPWVAMLTALHSLLDLTGTPIGIRAAAPAGFSSD